MPVVVSRSSSISAFAECAFCCRSKANGLFAGALAARLVAARLVAAPARRARGGRRRRPGRRRGRPGRRGLRAQRFPRVPAGLRADRRRPMPQRPAGWVIARIICDPRRGPLDLNGPISTWTLSLTKWEETLCQTASIVIGLSWKQISDLSTQ